MSKYIVKERYFWEIDTKEIGTFNNLKEAKEKMNERVEKIRYEYKRLLNDERLKTKVAEFETKDAYGDMRISKIISNVDDKGEKLLYDEDRLSMLIIFYNTAGVWIEEQGITKACKGMIHILTLPFTKSLKHNELFYRLGL